MVCVALAKKKKTPKMMLGLLTNQTYMKRLVKIAFHVHLRLYHVLCQDVWVVLVCAKAKKILFSLCRLSLVS